jgi:hypothetical protein
VPYAPLVAGLDGDGSCGTVSVLDDPTDVPGANGWGV